MPHHGLYANEVPATVLEGGRARCVTPAASAPSSRPDGRNEPIAFAISFNGHDFVTGGPATLFTYYAPAPQSQSVFPTSDTSAGGRALTVSGLGLSNGSYYLCRFAFPPTFSSLQWSWDEPKEALYVHASSRDETAVVCPSPAETVSTR